MIAQKRKEKIVMFYPYVTEKQRQAVDATLQSRFIGQGPRVDEFEKLFAERFRIPYCASVSSGSAALETACDILGLRSGDYVIATPLTCTATNIPLIRRGCKLLWADIDPNTLNMSQKSVDELLEKYDVKAVFNVHLGGIMSNIHTKKTPIVDDAAQAIGVFRREAAFTCYSFQAIKQITTGDGGMFCSKFSTFHHQAKLLRWFGIDREKKQKNNWEAYRDREMVFDIELPGHKRQMNDIAASMGIAGLEDFDSAQKHRAKLFEVYKSINTPGFALIDGAKNVHWLATVCVKNRDKFRKHLLSWNIECSTVQNRNDVYNIFGGVRQDLPVMNALENEYISIPLHTKMSIRDAEYIKEVILMGW
jgi:perosamine synthetase